MYISVNFFPSLLCQMLCLCPRHFFARLFSLSYVFHFSFALVVSFSHPLFLCPRHLVARLSSLYRMSLLAICLVVDLACSVAKTRMIRPETIQPYVLLEFVVVYV